MAQRTEKEETEFKAVPETITLCINNCGVTGNPATNNMCQKCFNATTAATSTSSSSPTGSSVTIPHNFAEKLVRSEKSARFSSLRSSPDRKSDLDRMSQDLKKVGDRMMVKEEDQLKASLPPAKREVNRCSGCRRKVGLTGFRCRCGELFCGEHRYSDRHDCSYDYKTAGREAIARENPVVKAAKIIKV
ncbi:zinc finger A20 and AN1 domain-containing stress-associated protein 5 [Solanum pennellii]|uniref:Zinc finger A20 and AN1 domain-containing stress-associated protein 5 n=2 Tax=Solanum pennellii TaxID=28526 RepID=A0ABM1FWG9_SOLPN|nr:zinc finger A20 and AN1 domain-containing stress-associated protein 5 [Solanum pennellii]